MLRLSRRTKIAVYTAFAVASYPVISTAFLPNYRTFPGKEENKTVVVTGATGNLGGAIAFQLAMKKARVIMACRNMEKCKAIRREIVLKTNTNNIVCRHLDLEDIKSISDFVANLEKTEPHVDVLVNNAAVKKIDSKEITKYGIERNFFVNYLAPVLLTFRLLDMLKRSAATTRDSRVINVIGTPKKDWLKSLQIDDINFERRQYNPDVAYKQSKLALAYFTILFEKTNKEQKNFVRVYGTSPCYTRIMKSLFFPTNIAEATKAHLDSWYCAVPDRTIMTVIRCALDPTFSDPERGGKLYTYYLTSWGWGVADKDELAAKKVWNATVKMLKKVTGDD